MRRARRPLLFSVAYGMTGASVVASACSTRSASSRAQRASGSQSGW
jgi:hypothetical protein